MSGFVQFASIENERAEDEQDRYNSSVAISCLGIDIGIRLTAPTNADAPGGHTQTGINPMNQRAQERLANIRAAPRCGARTRAGTPCQ